MTPFIFVLIFKTFFATENFIHACGCALESQKFHRRSWGEQEKSLQRQQSYLDTLSPCKKFALRENHNFLRSKESESRRFCFARLATTPVLVWRRYSERAASRFATGKLSLPKTSSAEGKERSGEKFCRSITCRTRPQKGCGEFPTLTKQQLTFNHR